MVADNVMISFLREELDSKATNIANRVSAAFFTASVAQAEENGGLFAHAIHEFSRCQVGDVIGNLELAPSASCFGMDNPVGELDVRRMLDRLGFPRTSQGFFLD